uniref:Zinc finger GRF-type domain-containing protein n=1 Tax=Daucus carota subsp. sativus TaxID=79200 RepID=A0A162A161_DAUCS
MSSCCSSHIQTPGLCSCGFSPVLRTSWTDANPGRRFWGCSQYVAGSRFASHPWQRIILQCSYHCDDSNWRAGDGPAAPFCLARINVAAWQVRGQLRILIISYRQAKAISDCSEALF